MNEPKKKEEIQKCVSTELKKREYIMERLVNDQMSERGWVEDWKLSVGFSLKESYFPANWKTEAGWG